MKKKTFDVRGFKGLEFQDMHKESCSIQEASNDGIWLGINQVTPKLFLPDVDKNKKGWIDYPMPDKVQLFGRMNLDSDMVTQLMPYLISFITECEIGDGKVNSDQIDKLVMTLKHAGLMDDPSPIEEQEPVDRCNWTSDGVNYYTECGHKYFTFIRDFNPEIVDDKCPWCGKPINREDEYDEEDY